MNNLQNLVKRRKLKGADSKQWLLISSESDSEFSSEQYECSESTSYETDQRLSLPSFSEKDKRATSKETSMDSVDIHSPQQKHEHDNIQYPVLTSRRNAICDVIEKHTYSDNGKKSLRKGREELLRVIALSNYSLL